MKALSDLPKGNSCVILEGKANYAAWAYTLKEHLITYGLFQHVGEEPAQPILAETSHSAHEGKSDRNLAQEAKSLVLSTLKASEVDKIIHCTTAREIWRHFETAYGQKSANAKLELLTELNSFSCKKASEVPVMANKILAIKGKLLGLKVELDEMMIISSIMRALPSSFSSFLESWNMFDIEQQTQDRFVSKLLERARSLAEAEEAEVAMLAVSHGQYAMRGGANRARGRGRGRGYGPGPSHGRMASQGRFSDRPPIQFPPSAFDGKPATGRNPIVCHYCKHIGHIKADCRKLKAKEEKRGGGHDDRFEVSEVCNMALAVKLAPPKQTRTGTFQSDWIADSGCSSHMSPERQLFQNYRAFESPVPIRIGDNSIVLAHGQGAIPTSVMKLDNVYFVPEMGANLLSIAKLADEGVGACFTHDGLTLVRDSKIVARGERRLGTYIVRLVLLSPTEVAMAATTLETWHKRLNHLPRDQVIVMMRKNLVDGLKLAAVPHDDCLECKLNKCRRQSHPTRTSLKATKAGQVLHFDVIGKISPPGRDGQNFILVCRDEFSKLRMISSLKSKSSCPEQIKLIINKTEMETGNSVLRIVSDNAAEFVAERLAVFLEHKGIEHILSAPYVPQQNGVAERENGILLLQANTILSSSRLPVDFWPEAVAVATYVSNRCVSTSQDQTPFQAWFGRRPNINNLRIFGQHASVLKPDNKRAKFGPRGDLMLFVGYTDNWQTYKFFDPQTKKIVVSCDAVFLEKVGAITEERPQQNEPTEGESVVTFTFDGQPESVDPIQPAADGGGSVPKTSRNASSTPSRQDSESDAADLQKSIEEMRRYLTETLEPENLKTPSSAGTDPAQAQPIDQNEPVLSNKGSSPVRDAGTGTLADNDDSLPPPPGFVIPSFPAVEQRRIRDSLRKLPVRNYRDIAKGTWDLSKKGDDRALVAIEKETLPRRFEDLADRPDRVEWYTAMRDEMQAMIDRKVFELVPRPSSNIVGSRWVFTRKLLPNGGAKCKARLVAQGFSQKFGVDYYSTYAPVVANDNVRLMFAIAALHRLKIMQADIRTAFLYGELQEEIYMRPPPGFQPADDRVWRLQKSLYGLKQAPRCWNSKVTEHITQLGLHQSQSDHCIFYKLDPLILIVLYVDDMLLLAHSENLIKEVLQQLAADFEVHIMSNNKFLGYQYQQLPNGDVYIHQASYIRKMLTEYDMQDANPVATPLATGQAVSSPLKEDASRFAEIVGSLLYAANQTRLDIAFAVGWLARHKAQPTSIDMQVAKRVLRYLKGTNNLGILYRASGSRNLATFADASFADDIPSYRSTAGLLSMLANGPVSWRSKLQDKVVTSITEAEFNAVTQAIKSVIQLRHLAHELKLLKEEVTPLFCDNKGAVLITTHERSSQRTRHMGATLNYAREAHENNIVHVDHCPAEDQLADVLTKPLAREKFSTNISKLMWSMTTLCCLLAFTPMASCGQLTLDNITLLKADYFVSRGYAKVTRFTHIPNHCGPLREALKVGPHESNEARMTIIGYLADKCDGARAQLYQPALGRLLGHTFHPRHSRSVSMLPLVASVSIPEPPIPIKFEDLPIPEEEQPGGAGAAWAKASCPSCDHLGQYYNENSAYNTVWKNAHNIRKLNHTLSSHTTQLGHQINVNRLQLANVVSVVNLLNSSHNRLEDVISTVPAAIDAASTINTNIIRDADALTDLAASFRKNQVNVMALNRVVKLENDELALLDTEVTMLSVVLRDNVLQFAFMKPLRDIFVDIFKLAPFKIWQSETEYLEYTGPRFVMHNVSNDCSKFIPEPDKRLVHDSCVTENTTVSVNQTLWTRQIVPINKRSSIKPTVIWFPLYTLIQCYPGNFSTSIPPQETPCPMTPFGLWNDLPVSVGGIMITQQYEALPTSATYSPKLDFNMHEDTTFKQELNQILATSAKISNETLHMEKLHQSDLEAWVSEHKVVINAAGIGSLVLILILVIFTVVFCFKPSSIDKLIDFQVKSMMLNHVSKSCANLAESKEPIPYTSMPNISIDLRKTEEEVPKTVKFDKFYPSVPSLPASPPPFDRPIRPPRSNGTPYHSRNPSLSSISTAASVRSRFIGRPRNVINASRSSIQSIMNRSQGSMTSHQEGMLDCDAQSSTHATVQMYDQLQ